MRTWYSAIILAIENKGPYKVQLQDIYSVIEKFRPLTAHDQDLSFGQENFKHTVRSYLKTLQKHKLVDYLGRATYSLTPIALKNLDVFKNESSGRSSSSSVKEIDITELLNWLTKDKES